jgi:hypothetical protein
MSVRRQPVRFSAASTGAASGASIEAVAASGIVDEHAEIVGEAAEEVCLYGHLDIAVVGANVAAARNP